MTRQAREFNFDRVAQEYDGSRGGVARAVAAADELASALPAGVVLELGVEPAIAALRALPDQDRRRPQQGHRTLTVLERPA